MKNNFYKTIVFRIDIHFYVVFLSILFIMGSSLLKVKLAFFKIDYKISMAETRFIL